MTIKEICELIVVYDGDDSELDDILDEAINCAKSDIRYIIGKDEYMLYINDASSLSIDSITLDPDDDGSDILEIALNKDNIHGFVEASEFEGDYSFLNGKVSWVESGTNDDGDAYKYIRFDTESGFDTEYVALTHEGSLDSLWIQDINRIIAYYAISSFVISAREVAKSTSIYITENYGEGSILPSAVDEIIKYSNRFKKKAENMLMNIYVKKHNDSNSQTESVSTL